MPTTHTVNCDAGEKIQDEIAIAEPGDTILVSGTCTENVTIGYLLRPLGHGPNTIRGSGEHGIAVTRGSSARIVGNTIENNKGSGVLVSRQSQADVFGNAISGNAGNGITASHNGGVNLDNEDKLFDLGPNRTDPGSKNAGAGLSGSVGGYADGPLGALTGGKGVKEMDGSCIDRLTA